MNFSDLNKQAILSDFPVTIATAMLFDKSNNLAYLFKPEPPHSYKTPEQTDRMTQVTYPDVTVSYGLNKVGNRVSESSDNGTTVVTKTYSHNNRDQITNITDTNGLSVAYSYDDTGNRIGKDQNGTITTFDYTPRQRIKSITKSGNTTSFKYDYLGNRIENSKKDTHL